MPPRRFIDKKNATTYQLVHRPQNDPLIHSSDAPQMVLAQAGSASHVPYQPSNRRNVKQRGDLEDEFGMSFRSNEGQAAEYGVYYDDTRYDYMQHLRDLGQGGGEATWVEAQAAKGAKGKGKVSLEDAIAGLDLDARSEISGSVASYASTVPEGMEASGYVRRTTYQDQQDVPDAIAGFRPDMDPRLREVLEALEDEAYVEEQEEDMFAEIAGDGLELDEDDFEYETWQQEQQDGPQSVGAGAHSVEDFVASQARPVPEDDDGWESDHTIRAGDDTVPPPEPETQQLPPSDPHAAPPATDPAWLDEYSKFKTATRKVPDAPSGVDAPPSLAENSLLSSLAAPSRTKKRKGARTSTTNYSMTSSALARTEPQSLLDARFDALMARYDADTLLDDGSSMGGGMDDTLSLASGVTGASRVSRVSRYSAASGVSRASGISTYSRASDAEAPELVRADFESIMDGFLEGQTKKGGSARRDVGVAPGRKGKRGVNGEGLRELEEMRKGLGKARLKT